MATATETRTAQRIGHATKLLAAMGGSPEGWDYTGEILEGDPARDKCACGHPIRWLFIWENTTQIHRRTLITGSVCVENLPGITAASIEAMKADLEGALAAKKAAAKKAREAAAQEEVTALREATLAKIERTYGWAIRWRDENPGEWLASGTYRAIINARDYRGLVRKAGKLKTARGQINRLQSIGEALDYNESL